MPAAEHRQPGPHRPFRRNREEYLRSQCCIAGKIWWLGYGDARTILRRVRKMEEWLATCITCC
jgi:aconitase B